MIRTLRTHFARKRLARIVEQRRQSFEIESYRRHRAAALKARRT